MFKINYDVNFDAESSRHHVTDIEFPIECKIFEPLEKLQAMEVNI